MVLGHGRVLYCGTAANCDLLSAIPSVAADRMAIEMVAHYGMPVGKEVFDTCVWIGRFLQVWPRPDEVELVYRGDVKLELCGTRRAKDPNVRQALIDRLGKPGTKKVPGATYGVTGHIWSALAVAVVAGGPNEMSGVQQAAAAHAVQGALL